MAKFRLILIAMLLPLGGCSCDDRLTFEVPIVAVDEVVPFTCRDRWQTTFEDAVGKKFKLCGKYGEPGETVRIRR